jgi:hypothetical protein
MRQDIGRINQFEPASPLQYKTGSSRVQHLAYDLSASLQYPLSSYISLLRLYPGFYRSYLPTHHDSR